MKKSAFSKFSVISFLSLFLLSGVSFAEWKATASSSGGSSESADKAIDGDISTRWSSEFKDNQWLKVDLGKQIQIEVIVLYWEAAFTKEYAVEVSKNGSSWSEVYSTANGKGGKEVIKINPVQARYVKINCQKRGTEWGNSLWEVKFEEAAANSKASASSGTDDYSPDKALDGDKGTRWSSNFEDGQYWEVEFEKSKMLCGLTIHWETAFGEIFNVEVSEDGKNFHKVYETADGDGSRDVIYFSPALVKKLRLNGIQRGTGWGFSIWEIDFHNGNNPPKYEASSYVKGNEPSLVLDGDKKTAWQSKEEKQSNIAVSLPRVWGLGGVILTWADNYAVKYSVELYTKDNSWKKVYETDSGNGGVDWVYFSPVDAKKIRVNCIESVNGKGFSLAEIELKTSEEKATPIKTFQARAKDLREGMYPMWLRRVQEFWTVIGEVNNEQESLFGETGIIEPYKGAFSVVPFVFEGNKVNTWADCKLSQNLIDNYLPIPESEWKGKNFNLKMTAFTNDKNTIVRYAVKNTSNADFNGKLALAVLPVQLNPVWQHGGFSPIHNASFLKDGGKTALNINKGAGLVSISNVSGFGAMDSKDKDVITLYGQGKFPSDSSAANKDGFVSCGFWYDLNLKEGGEKDIYVVYPLHAGSQIPGSAVSDPKKFFDENFNDCKTKWEKLLNHFEIKIPEQRFVRIMQTNIAYILINRDGPWTKPGSRNYNHSWVRDGAMTCVALMRMGLTKEVKEWIEAVTPHVDSKGMVPYIFFEGGNPMGFNYGDFSGEGKEFDSQGQYIFAIRQYYDYTNDKEFLKKVYSKAVKSAEFIKSLRSQRLTDEYRNGPYYGILPLSNSHEGYYPAKHSYWDDFWGLRGYKDAIYLAKEMGRADDVKWLESELTDFRTATYGSILAVIKRDNLKYIPGCVEKGDYDPTSTAIAIMVGGEENHLPQPYLDDMFEKYIEEFITAMEPGKERTFTPYEVRSADAFIRMNKRDNALIMLRYFTKDSVRPYGWNHMAEVVHARPRAPSYIGDMPHTWVGSGYISTIRTIFAYEHEGKLIVGAGLAPEWLKEGVTVKGLPTIYGPIDYSVSEKSGVIEFNFGGQSKPPLGFVLPLPKEYQSHKVYVNGTLKDIKDGNVNFKKLPVKIELKK